MVVYTGFATPDRLHVSGRVLEDEGEKKPDGERSAFENIVEAAKKFETDEVEDAEVTITLGGRTWTRTTDDDGIWTVEVGKVAPPLRPGRHTIKVRLAEDPGTSGEGEVVVLADEPGVAVISDFDDTVIVSEVTDKKRLLVNTLTRNAAQLVPVRGVAEAYGRAEASGTAAFFYLSGSPQNLYDRIDAFLRLRKLPTGPIFLKNFGSDSVLGQGDYKRARIELLLEFFPNLRFILIGDSGEHDPEIYGAVRVAHPKRVVGILIRKVPGDESPAGRFAGMKTVRDYRKSAPGLAQWVRGR